MDLCVAERIAPSLPTSRPRVAGGSPGPTPGRARRQGLCPVRLPLSGLALVLAGLAGCGDGERYGAEEPVVTDSAGVTVVTHPESVLAAEAPFRLASDPAVRIGMLDGPDEVRFTRIVGAAPLADGSIAVLEGADREIRVFDSEGHFQRRIGGPGDGPGEFRLPQALQRLPGDTLLVWDSGASRLSWFDVEGELVRDEQVDTGELGRISTVHAMGDGTVTLVVVDRARDAVDSPDDGLRRRESVLVQWDGSDGELREWAEVAGAETLVSVESSSDGMMRISMGQPWYGASLLTSGSGERLWWADGTRWEFKAWSPALGTVEMVVRIDAPLEPFDAAFIRELEDGELEAADDESRRDAVRQRHQATEYPEWVPPFRRLVAGSDGRVWLGLTQTPPVRLPGGAGPELWNWLVLDPEGTVLGRVTLPPRTRLLHAGAHDLLLVRFDELDLPYLERFRLDTRGDPGPET